MQTIKANLLKWCQVIAHECSQHTVLNIKRYLVLQIHKPVELYCVTLEYVALTTITLMLA